MPASSDTPQPLVDALDFDHRMIPAHGQMGVDYEQRVDFRGNCVK